MIHFQTVMYTEPSYRKELYFHNYRTDRPFVVLQHGTTQYCVLEVNPLGLYYMETVTYQPVTSQVGQIIQDVKGLRYVPI